jgi:hypothetical protein
MDLSGKQFHLSGTGDNKDDDRPRKAYQAMSCVCSTVLVSVLAGGVDGPCRVSGRPERQLS